MDSSNGTITVSFGATDSNADFFDEYAEAIERQLRALEGKGHREPDELYEIEDRLLVTREPEPRLLVLLPRRTKRKKERGIGVRNFRRA